MPVVKVKCAKCGRTLMLAAYVKGEIKCPRCGNINRISIKSKGKSQ